MKIEIKVDDNDKEDAASFILTDENLDNDNFIDILFDDKEITVSIDELFSALTAFDSKRSRQNGNTELFNTKN